LLKNEVGEEKVNLTELLFLLGKRGLNEVLIESGSQLAGAFIEQELVNELILFQAPKLIGGQGKSLVQLVGVNELSAVKKLTINDVTMVGPDIRIIATFDTTESY
jgi:diaminohydroxyphosphoribosylaminopyrimidine deaminase/5-amino-6-(5-phosphoribosylamino)uracil reductase